MFRGFWRSTASLAAVISLLFLSTLAWDFLSAYTVSREVNSNEIRWPGRPILNFAGNPKNSTSISESYFFKAVSRSLQRWKEGSGESVDFNYWQGTDPAFYETNSEYNGLSSVYFASAQKTGETGVDAGVIGVTQVWYNTNNGEIFETDIVLNDIHFDFTDNPDDTSGYGSGDWSRERRVYLENVLTHEIGHAYGLTHAGSLQSSMLFMEAPDQAHLSCDEKTGIRSMYAPGVGGGLQGTVVSRGGSPIFGAHVVAISRDRGTVMATALSDKNGRYRIGALEPGTYFLMVEPFYAGGSVLSEYYLSLSSRVCGGGPFRRTFHTRPGANELTPFQVVSSGTVNVPEMKVSCFEIGYSSGGGGRSIASIQDGGIGFADMIQTGTRKNYILSAVEGDLKLRILAYSLYSPVKISARLVNSRGQSVEGKVNQPVYESDSGFRNFDAEIVAQDLPLGDYTLEVSIRTLDQSFFPAGSISLDSSRFIVVTGHQGEVELPFASTLPNNAKCRSSENYPDYVSPEGAPMRTNPFDDDEGNVGFCGTVAQIHSQGGDDDFGSPPAGAVLGWFLPWMLMLGVARLYRSRFANA